MRTFKLFVISVLVIILTSSVALAVVEPPPSKQLTFFKTFCSYMGAKHYSENSIITAVDAFPISIPSGNFYKGEPNGISNRWAEQICMDQIRHSGHNWALWNVRAIKAAQNLSPNDEAMLHYSGCLSDSDFMKYFKPSGICDYLKGGEQFANRRGLPIVKTNTSHTQATTNPSH